MSSNHSNETASINYVAFKTKGSLTSSIGRLDAVGKYITPLAYKSGTPLKSLYEVIEIGESNVIKSGEPIALSDVKLLPPISGRDVLAVGKNYAEHAKEFNSSGYDSSDKVDQPSHPVIFTKRATSIIAHEDEIYPHKGFTDTLDYEGEIGVIVGKPGFKIKAADAMNHVWGYTIINDVTARERQRDHKQFYIGKSGDTFCPMGPVAVPKESLPNVLRVQTFVNGEKRQEATTDDLIFNVPVLLETMSSGQTLQPGDVLATGTPAGVGFGFDPKKWLKPGDEVTITVTGLGSLVNRIAPFDSPNPIKSQVESTQHASSSNNKTAGLGLTNIGTKQLFYQARGASQGSSVICIHGLGGSSEYYTPLVSKLGKSHTLHVSDLEGHGLSPTTATSVLSIGSFAEDIYALIKSTQIKTPATVIAHSMGCLVALKFALEHPDLVKELVLMGAPPSPLPEAGSKGTYARAATVRASSMLAVVDTIVGGGLSEHVQAINPLAVAAARTSLLSQDIEGYAKACTALADSANETLDISKIKCRTLLLTGNEDKISPPALNDKMKGQISQSQVKVLDNVAHWHMYEDVNGVLEAIAAFVEAK